MRFMLKVFVCSLLASPLAAQGTAAPTEAAPPQSDAAAILSMDGVITAQLGAFNARDLNAAWQFASPKIQMLFGGPGNFGTMVQQGYPMVWDNSAAKFIDQRRIGATTYRQVMVQDTNGVLHILEYAMIETSQGWKIDGVTLLPAPDVGV